MEMNETQIQALLNRIDARVDARVDSQLSSKLGSTENMTPIAFENKWMGGYTSTMPIDQALFRRFLHALSSDDIIGKNFKTIGSAVATTKEDTLSLEGSDGITITYNGKTITLSATILKNTIDSILEWENEDVNKAKVLSWMNGPGEGTALYGKYFKDFSTMDKSNRLSYWNEVISLATGGSRIGVWIPYSEEYMCLATPKLVRVSGASGYTNLGSVYIPTIDYYVVIAENYTSSSVVDNAVIQSETAVVGMYNTLTTLSSNYTALEARVSALEGN